MCVSVLVACIESVESGESMYVCVVCVYGEC